MDLKAFEATLGDAALPDGLSPALGGLWWDGHGDWDAAHRAVQDSDTAEAAWVHAYLHRKEGDLSNARYWYRRAGREMPEASLDAEWASIASALLGAGG